MVEQTALQLSVIDNEICNRVDYGSVYASKSWRAEDGRRLWMGWVFETLAGCFQQCSSGTPFTTSQVNLGFMV